MWPLLKIRVKHLVRYEFIIFWSNVIIPIIGLIFILFIVFISKIVGNKILDVKNKDYIRKGNISSSYLFNTDIYYNWFHYNSINEIKSALKATVFLVNNENDKNLIYNFIYNETGIEVNCYLEYNQINESYKNLIKLKNENGKYRFDLIQNDTNEYLSKNNYPYHYTRKLLDLKSKDSEKSIDFFYVNDLSNNYLDNEIINNFQIFLEIQSLLSKYLILKERKSGPNINLTISIGANRYPNYTNFNNNYNVGEISAICFSGIISFLLSLLTYSFNLEMIDEKEKKLTLFLERKGVTKIQYFLTWFISYLFLMFLVIIIIIIFGSIFFIFFYFIFIVNILLYFLSLFSILLFFYSYISTVKKGFIILKLFNIFLPFFGLFLAFLPIPKSICIIFSLIPQINVIFCTKCIFKLQTFPSLSNEKLWLKAYKLSYIECIIIYIADIIIYFSLFLIKIYQKQIITFIKRKIMKKDNFQNQNIILEISNSRNLKINNIKKIYNNKKVINKISLELFPNEIFCLLGRNGEGKTSLINIIAGFIEPDGGDIIYNGKSMIKDKVSIIDNIEICQQEDIFFNYLTVKEYLQIISEIKYNKSLINIKEKIDELIKFFHMNKNENCLCSLLSEGEKRKLSLILSLIGDSNILLLDEPTRGIDSNSKKEIWNYLKTIKTNKIILIGTYLLDEAKNVGDKIGIISEGKLIESGSISSLEAKNNEDICININTETPGINDDIIKNIFQIIKDKYEKKALIQESPKKNSFSIIINQNNENFIEIFKLLEENGMNYSINTSHFYDILVNKIENIKEEEIKLEKNQDIPASNTYQKIKIYFQIIIMLLSMKINKILFLIEFLFIFIFSFIVIFAFSDIIINIGNKDLNLLKILEEHPIYIYEYQDNYFKNSEVYSLSKSINFKKIKTYPNDINVFIDNVYDNSYANIAKGSISIKKDLNYSLEAFNTYIYTNYNSYFYANTMLIVSSFLKNEYNIDAAIFPEIKEKKLYKHKDTIESHKKTAIALSISCSGLFFLIILTGLVYDMIKDDIIKHLGYLGRVHKKMISIIFFIFYFIKLLIYCIVLNAPIIYLSEIGKYILIDYILICISSIIFICAISKIFQIEKLENFIFILIIILILIIGLLLYIYYKVVDRNKKISDYFVNLIQYKKYKFSYFDITPLTSMILSFIRLFNSYINNNKVQKIYIDSINQFINIIFYSILLVGLEYIHDLKLYFYKNKKNSLELKANQRIISGINGLQDKMLDTKEKNSFELKSNKENIMISISNGSNDEILNTNKNNINNIKTNNNNYIINFISIIGLIKIMPFNCCKKSKLKEIIFYNFQIQENEKVGLLEPNGKGKTLLFKSITNEISSDLDTISLFGKDIKKRNNFNSIKNDIGYCPQINNDFFSMKVREILNLFLYLQFSNIKIESISKIFYLNNYLDINYNNLSYCNKRKLHLAISFINEPKLLLLDNPLNGVDIISRKLILKNIHSLFNNENQCTMILSTNLNFEPNIICDKNINLNSNKKIQEKKPNYNFFIKFDESINNDINISNEQINELLDKIRNYVNIKGFEEKTEMFLNNPKIYPCLSLLYDLYEKNIYNISYFHLEDFSKDLIFKLDIAKIDKKKLFVDIINMKKNNSIILKLKAK